MTSEDKIKQRRLYVHNKIKLEELKNDFHIPYEIEYFYFYFTCKPYNKKKKGSLNYKIPYRELNRKEKLKTLKNHIDRKPYCFKLYEDTIAKIKYHDNYFQLKLDNHFYIFSDINPDDFAWNTFEVVYNTKELNTPMYHLTKINNILDELKERRYSQKDLDLLRRKIFNFSFFRFDDFIDSSKIETEFIYRYTIEEELYKVKVDEFENEEKSKREDYLYIFSMFKNINKEELDDLVSLFKEIKYYKYFTRLRKKRTFDKLREYFKRDPAANDFQDIEDYIKQIFNKLHSISISSKYLMDVYSDDYKERFKFFRNRFTLYKTQKILRNQKQELKEITKYEDIFSDLLFSIKDLNKELFEFEGIENKGLGYSEDISDDSMLIELRDEELHERILEGETLRNIKYYVDNDIFEEEEKEEGFIDIEQTYFSLLSNYENEKDLILNKKENVEVIDNIEEYNISTVEEIAQYYLENGFDLVFENIASGYLEDDLLGDVDINSLISSFDLEDFKELEKHFNENYRINILEEDIFIP